MTPEPRPDLTRSGAGQLQSGLQHNDITWERLRLLARLRVPADVRVLSLYLDLDPSENLALPSARRSAITALVDEAHRQVEALRELSHSARMAVRADLRRVADLLERRAVAGDLAEGARALALFACQPMSLLETLRLPRPVRPMAALARRAVIQPLAEIGPPRSWAVLLSDGDDARLLEGRGERLEEVERFRDELRRRAAHGVWAPERTDAPLPEDELAHVRRTVELLSERARERGYERIAVGAGERIYREILRRLDGEVRERVIGRFDVDADEASIAEVRGRVEPLLRAADEAARRAALAQLDARGVCGLQATLAALHERRVGTLLVRRGLERPGWRCPLCGRARDDSGPCPLDGSPTEAEPNVIDWALALAVEQDAQILALDEGLERCQDIASLLRF